MWEHGCITEDRIISIAIYSNRKVQNLDKCPVDRVSVILGSQPLENDIWVMKLDLIFYK